VLPAQTGESLAEQLEKEGQLLQSAQQQLREQQAAHQAAQEAHAAQAQQLQQELKEAQQQLAAWKERVRIHPCVHIWMHNRPYGLIGGCWCAEATSLSGSLLAQHFHAC
jgi:DNA repair exonuclease SbcCD ATPase subunit